MKHLYIIGNGFDIFSGLRTGYVDFRHWLQYTYPFIYENMCEAYEMDGEWWHNFEIQLGKLDVPRYVRKFTPPEKPLEEIMKEIDERRAFEEKYNLPTDYEQMMSAMIYGEKPSWDELMVAMKELQERVRNCVR